VLDYAEGVYQVDLPGSNAASIPTCRNTVLEGERQGYTTGKMSFAELVEVPRTGTKAESSKDAPKEITIFDVQDQTASAKLVAAWGTDYFHLAKYDGKWMIVNVLWQSPPRKIDEMRADCQSAGAGIPRRLDAGALLRADSTCGRGETNADHMAGYALRHTNAG
jgi:hypothetical protein